MAGKSRHLTRLLPPVVAATFTTALLASDWDTGVGQFWKDHAITAGVVSGLALLVLTVVGIERWLRHREQKHWERVSHISYKALGNALGVASDVLWRIQTGIHESSNDELPGSAADWEVIDNLHRDLGGPDGGPARRLLADQSWCLAAAHLIRASKLLVRDAIARWAPVMLTHDRLSKALNETAAAGDLLSSIQRQLIQGPGGCDPETTIEEIEAAQETFVILREQLYGQIGDHWESPERRRLSDDGLARLEAAVAPYRGIR